MDARIRRMVLATFLTLGGAAVLGAAAFRANRDLAPVVYAGLLFWVLSGHVFVIEEDRRRRGVESGGCITVLVALGLPPFGVTLYLIATYRSMAVVLVPLYFGLISLTTALAWSLAWLLRRM